MSVTLVHSTANSLFYSAATAIIRYIYVKNSLKANITAVMKKDAYKIKAIVTVESLGLYNLVSFYFFQYGKNKSPLTISKGEILQSYNKHEIFFQNYVVLQEQQVNIQTSYGYFYD